METLTCNIIEDRYNLSIVLNITGNEFTVEYSEYHDCISDIKYVVKGVVRQREFSNDLFLEIDGIVRSSGYYADDTKGDDISGLIGVELVLFRYMNGHKGMLQVYKDPHTTYNLIQTIIPQGYLD